MVSIDILLGISAFPVIPSAVFDCLCKWSSTLVIALLPVVSMLSYVVTYLLLDPVRIV